MINLDYRTYTLVVKVRDDHTGKDIALAELSAQLPATLKDSPSDLIDGLAAMLRAGAERLDTGACSFPGRVLPSYRCRGHDRAWSARLELRRHPDGYASGQRTRAVNASPQASQVRILPHLHEAPTQT